MNKFAGLLQLARKREGSLIPNLFKPKELRSRPLVPPTDISKANPHGVFERVHTMVSKNTPFTSAGLTSQIKQASENDGSHTGTILGHFFAGAAGGGALGAGAGLLAHDLLPRRFKVGAGAITKGMALTTGLTMGTEMGGEIGGQLGNVKANQQNMSDNKFVKKACEILEKQAFDSKAYNKLGKGSKHNVDVASSQGWNIGAATGAGIGHYGGRELGAVKFVNPRDKKTVKLKGKSQWFLGALAGGVLGSHLLANDALKEQVSKHKKSED